MKMPYLALTRVKTSIKTVGFSVALAASLLQLSGCETVLAGAGIMAAHHYINEEDPNLMAQNYAVADYLVQQAHSFVTPQSRIVARPLLDSETPEISTKLAKLIPEQIGTRFQQLGYRVDLSPVTKDTQDAYMPTQAGQNDKVDAFITGSYKRNSNNQMDVKIRMIEVKTDRIIASFDYSVHLSRGIQSLSEQKPKIMRMTPSE